VENLELRCRAHNVYEAEKYFSRPLFVREKRADWDLKLGPDPVAWTDRDLTCTAFSASELTMALWKLPELWTQRAASTSSLENAECAFSTDRMKRLAPLSDVVACAPRLLTRSQAQ
jgi:hypothetical protein